VVAAIFDFWSNYKLVENHQRNILKIHNLIIIFQAVSEKMIFLNFSLSEWITGRGSHVEFQSSTKNVRLCKLQPYEQHCRLAHCIDKYITEKS
jgi:hypothetical protein